MDILRKLLKKKQSAINPEQQATTIPEPENVEKLLRELQSEVPYRRKITVQKLGKLKKTDVRIISALNGMASDSNQAVRSAAREALRTLRHESPCLEKQSSEKGGELQKKVEIKQALQKSRERHQLPNLGEILDILVAVEQLTNYATVVEIALETAAEYRGVYFGDLKSAYMKFWWWWHNHRDEPKYRAEKVVVIAGEAAQVYPDSEIGWTLISHLLVWIDEGGPGRSEILKNHFGEIPTLN